MALGGGIAPDGKETMKYAVLALFALAASPAVAQTAPSQILVSASGTALTPPDVVTVGFTLRGEGSRSDEAVTRLRDSAKAVNVGVAGLLQHAEDYHSSTFTIAPVRAKECDQNNYGQQRLSTGVRAIIGYIATMPVTIDTSRVGDAGTLTGLIGRLGGLEPGIRRFWLRDESAARRRATQAALTSAQAQARSIAEGSGARLGALLRVQDADYREISIDMDTAQPGRADAQSAPPPPPPPPPPVRIDLAPDPIQTVVRLMVAYAINR